MYVDYRQLNKQTIKDKFPIPIIEELINELYGSPLFTNMDLRSGYHQIRINDVDVAETELRTHEGHYEFLNAIWLNQCTINILSLKDHEMHLRTMLTVMRQHKLYAKKSKCVFGTDRVEYLGHVIFATRVATDLEKVITMSQWPMPTNVKQLRSVNLLGAVLNLGPAGNWLTLSNRGDPKAPKAVTKPIAHIEGYKGSFFYIESKLVPYEYSELLLEDNKLDKKLSKM
ncbi:hypothetical protein Tco_0833091 [Tanacetum coccineum]